MITTDQNINYTIVKYRNTVYGRHMELTPAVAKINRFIDSKRFGHWMLRFGRSIRILIRFRLQTALILYCKKKLSIEIEFILFIRHSPLWSFYSRHCPCIQSITVYHMNIIMYVWNIVFLAHLSWKLKVSYCDHSPSVVVVVVVVRMSVRPSVRPSTIFKQHLLLNHWLDFDQTSQEWSLVGSLSKLFKWFRSVAYLDHRS